VDLGVVGDEGPMAGRVSRNDKVRMELNTPSEGRRSFLEVSWRFKLDFG